MEYSDKYKLTDRQEWAWNKFWELSAEKGLSLKKTAELVGVSASTISGVKNGTYGADPCEQLEKVAAYFELKEASAESAKYDKYVPTSISTRVYQIIKSCHMLGGIAVARGDAGVGKTQAALKYAKDHEKNCIYIYVPLCLGSANEITKEIGLRLGVRRRAIGDLWRGIVEKLTDGTIIILDEAQHLSYEAIEMLRSFSDIFDSMGKTVGICLIGNEVVIEKTDGKNGQTTGRRQIISRRKSNENFTTEMITRQDINLLFPEFEGQKPITDFLLELSKGVQGIRGAVDVVIKAKDNENTTYAGLVAAAKSK